MHMSMTLLASFPIRLHPLLGEFALFTAARVLHLDCAYHSRHVYHQVDAQN